MKLQKNLCAIVALCGLGALNTSHAEPGEVDWRRIADWNCQVLGDNNFSATDSGGLKMNASYGSVVCPIETNHTKGMYWEDNWALQEIWVRVQEKKSNTISTSCNVRLRTPEGGYIAGPFRTVPNPSVAGSESIRFKKSDSTIPMYRDYGKLYTEVFYSLFCTLGKDDVLIGYRTRVAERPD